MATGPKKETQTAIEIVGMRQLLRALSKIPKDLQNDVRDASQAIANDLASAGRNAAQTPLQVLAATGLKAKRDRVPVVTSGRGAIRPGVRATDIWYGAEFGGAQRPTTQQFPPHKGRRGYFFYPTARAHGDRYADLWADAVDKAFKEWDYRAPTTGT